MKRVLAVLAAAAAASAFPATAGDAALAISLGLPEIALERAEADLASLPPGRERDEAFLAAAAAKERLAAPSEVVEWLDSVGEAPSSAAWFRARALAALGRPAEAASALGGLLQDLEEGSPLAASVRADLAHALSAADDAAGAALLLGGTSGGDGGPAAAFALAAEILAGGEPAADAPESLKARAYAAAAALRARREAGGPPGDEALNDAERAVAMASDPDVLAECRAVLLEIQALRVDSENALDTARKIVSGRRTPQGTAAVRAASAALLAAGDPSSALALADLHASSFAEPDSEAAVQRLRALALEALGRPSEAVAAWDAAREAADARGDSAASAEARLEGVRLCIAAGRPGDARERLVAARAAGLPAELEARAVRLDAECLAAESSPDASAAFDDIAGADPSSPEEMDAALRAAETSPASDAAALAARASRADAAVAAMAAAASDADEAALAMVRQADAALAVALKLQAAGDASNALARLELAASVPGGGPSAERAMALLPAAYQAAGRADEALAAHSIFTNQHPESAYLPDVAFWRASRAFDSADWPLAASMLLSFADGAPDSPKTPHAVYLAAVALLRSGREEEAVAAVDRLGKAAPDSPLLPEARFMQAEALASLMRFDAAARAFARVAAAGAPDPVLPLRASMRRADCLFALGGDIPARRAESLAVYRSVMADPAFAGSGLESECRWKIGRALAKDGDRDAALREWFDGCIAPFERDPGEDAAPWYSRAVFSAAAELVSAGRRDSAVAVLSRLASSADLPGREEAARRIEALESM